MSLLLDTHCNAKLQYLIREYDLYYKWHADLLSREKCGAEAAQHVTGFENFILSKQYVIP